MGFVDSIVAGMRPQNMTSTNMDNWLRYGTNSTWSGISVNSQNALTVSTVFACTRVIAEDIGKLPFVVYQQSGDRERDRATGSPFWRLLHDRPNSFQTSQQFREYMTACALLRGNGYALKNTVGGQVRELLPLHPDQVRVEQLDDFELIYHVRLKNGAEEEMTRKQIFHLPGLTINGPVGISIIEYARQTIGNALGANRHAGTFFGNGMKPSGVFTHPGKLSEPAHERLKRDLNEKHGGENSNNTLLVEEGMSYHPISLNAKDSQFLESRTFEVLEICRWFRIQPHKIAELSRATFSNIEHQAIEYVADTLMPWAKRWEYAVNQQVIVTNNIFAELLFDALLRGTTKDRYEAYQIALGGNNGPGFMTVEEVRLKENYSPEPALGTLFAGPSTNGGTNASNNPA
jgi:HK97 family phage portal protein